MNVVGALAPYDPAGPLLLFESRRQDQGRYDALTHLRFVERIAGLPSHRPEGWRRERRCVIVEDNYSVHHSKLVNEEMPALAAAGVEFFFLSPYSPDLNEIEPVWRQVKYQEMPERSYLSAEALQQAVEAALTDRAERYRKSTTLSLRPA